MKTFYIIANSDKEDSRKLSCEIADYLNGHGQRCLIRKGGESGSAEDYEPPVSADMDGILVLGGDGTLLRAARNLSDRNIPFLGVNLGHLGYLAEIELHGLYSALDRLIAGEYTVENRMMLKGTVWANGTIAEEDIALNDIVLNRMGTLRVIDYEIYVNGEYLNSFTADGLIVSTPTGSTGYSLSAGGPIVSPTAETLILTPICPHTLNSRSIVFSGSDRIRIEIGKGRRGGYDEAFAAFDGDHYVKMRTGDYVEIGKSAQITKILKISQVSFLEVLRDKLSR